MEIGIPLSSCFAFPLLNVFHHEFKSRFDCTASDCVDAAGFGPALAGWPMTGLGCPPFAMPH